MLFDFCPNSRVAEELPPEEARATTMNGWDFTSRPAVPYRPSFKVTLEGLYWYLGETGLDLIKNPTINAGLLRDFYIEHLTWKVFEFQHEYLGLLECRFASAVTLPKALPNSGGLLPPVEVTLIHHNPGYIT